jgi:heme/copper-type cytochrome/quinol oxidase subunit 2
MQHTRRDFLQLAGIGGIVFASGLGARAFGSEATRGEDFYFVQLSDTHWGFDGPEVNPDAKGTLAKAVAAVNALDDRPDFVVFTGDLTHTTEDPKTRRDRMKEFRDIAGKLDVKQLYFLAGEHDAAPDRGEAYQELFGKLHYSFDHKGVHFVVLDNCSDPNAVVGDEQLAWMKSDLAKLRKDAPVVVLTHRPLFDLYPQWDWATRDAPGVIDALTPYTNVTVFYGHIHQENHHMTGHIPHHAAKSLMFPMPAAGSMPKKAPIPWDPAAPYRGLGFREIATMSGATKYDLRELPIAAPAAAARVVKIEARRFAYVPSQVTLRRGVPVTFELTSRDVAHGFSLPDFGVRAKLEPGEVARVAFTPDKVGTFTFLCDFYCGAGHEDMSGTVVVTE